MKDADSPPVRGIKTSLSGCVALAVALCLAGCAARRQDSGSSLPPGGELETRIVRIQALAGVEPLNLFIRPGTVVLWLNQYPEDIRILFPGRKVTIACMSPVNFTLTAEGFFESGQLPNGAVASLCFIQPGAYSYSIERVDAARRAKSEGFRLEGVITVR